MQNCVCRYINAPAGVQTCAVLRGLGHIHTSMFQGLTQYDAVTRCSGFHPVRGKQCMSNRIFRALYHITC